MSKKKRTGPPRAAEPRPEQRLPEQRLPASPAGAAPTRPQRPAPVTVAPVAPQSAPVAEPAQPAFGLIRFDRRVRLLIGICIGLFVLLTLAKINYSSITIWNQVIPDGSDPKRGLITGTPRNMRLDEWGVLAPAFLSQANLGYPVTNPGIGGDQTPLVMNLPVKHFIGLFRPDYWGFLLLGTEMGFAWWWNFKIFFTLISVTLFFLVLTRNNFWLSVFGAFWVTFSAGMVWWSMFFNLPIALGCLTFVLFMELLYSRRRFRPLLLSVPLMLLSTMFALHLYPAFQVPFAFILLTLIVTYIVQYKWTAILENIPVKVASLGLVAVGIGMSGYLYYSSAKATLDAMTKTVYPGQRANAGGEGFIANGFSDYYTWQVSDTKFPATWSNICEMSHFVTFTPVIILCLLLLFVRTRTVPPLLMTGLLLISVAFWTYIEWGWPIALAKATLMSTSMAARVQLPLGFAGLVLTILYLNELRTQKVAINPSFLLAGLVGVLVIMVYAANLNVSDSGGFFKMSQLLIPTFFFFVLGVLLLPDVQFRYRVPVFCAAMVLYMLPNLKVNPVGIGMAPITDNIFYKTINDIRQREPNAKWVVFGAQPLTFMAMATGINQLSGLKNQPDLKTMRVLDPTAKSDSAYNRHARPVYYPYIDGRDSTVIQLGQAADIYTVGIDPCSPKLKTLGVKYFVFDHQTQPAEVRCLKLVTSLGTIQIYRTTD